MVGHDGWAITTSATVLGQDLDITLKGVYRLFSIDRGAVLNTRLRIS